METDWSRSKSDKEISMEYLVVSLVKGRITEGLMVHHLSLFLFGASLKVFASGTGKQTEFT